MGNIRFQERSLMWKHSECEVVDPYCKLMKNFEGEIPLSYLDLALHLVQ